MNDAGHGRGNALVPPFVHLARGTLAATRLRAMDRTEANSGTRAVNDALRFDVAALEAWMAANVAGFAGPLDGQPVQGRPVQPDLPPRHAPAAPSCCAASRPAALLPGAHAVDREARVMGALGADRLPRPAHPRAVRGRRASSARPSSSWTSSRAGSSGKPPSPGLTPTERAAHFDAMNATIAQLHSIDPGAIGLADYGRPAGFVERQVARWSKQYLADTAAGRLPQMDALVDWLGTHLPPDRGDASRRPRRFSLRQYDLRRRRAAHRRRARLGIVDARRSARRLRLSSADVPHARGPVHRARRARPRRARHPVRGRLCRGLLPPHRAATICPTSII